MIDTIGVQYHIAIPKQCLTQEWGFHREPTRRGYKSEYKREEVKSNGCKLTYKYQPYAIKVGPLLKVEVSLPHLLYGDNLYMILDLESAVNQANSMLPKIPGIPDLDLWLGDLYRLDFAYNFKVGILTPSYIRAVLPLEFNRRKSRPYSEQGFQWGNTQWASKIYNKELWYKDKRLPVNVDAKGVLRLELTLRRNKIKHITRKKSPTLHDISIEMAMNTLDDELSGLHLLDQSIGTYDTTLAKLCEIYGTDAGFCYFGALAANVEYPGRDSIVVASGIHPRTLERRLQKVMEAGSPLTLTKCDEPLPALYIDRAMVKELMQQGASVMKYQVIQ